ncbi:OLC1v1038598C2 [Oldenlandia corymbosa var. corymbosa]|nr:OLC1v1038598C2 [Oldenlandia corymbosa var. corymbosa]
MVSFVSCETAGSSLTTNSSSHRSTSSFANSSNGARSAPLVHEEIARTTVAASSQTSTALVNSSQVSQSGIPIFQGLIERVKKTVRGSADDIGWLQRAPDLPPVEDGTERFIEILDDIRHGLRFLPKSMVYLLVPGLFSNHGPLYFVSTKTRFSKMGLTCHIAKIHSEASVETNAKELKDYIEEIYWGSRKRVLLLGHSKGGVDAAAALSMYWPDLKDKVAGLALAQSPYGGSPIASDILREGQLGDYVNIRRLMEILICKVIKGDMQALEDLTYDKRKEFLRKYHLPKELPVVSFHTEASISPAVLATLSRVAHAELPTFTPLSAGERATLPVVMPLGAVMAANAQLLQIRYGEKSDGLVTCRDAEVPGSVVVRPKRKLDHAWMVYSSLNDDPSEADASQVCEALLTLLVEVGMKKRQEFAKKDE